jgi:hypothetical protein
MPSFHQTDQDPALGPIFVVGMNGSGTTMLSDCLDNSPELYVFPWETRAIPWFITNSHRFGDLEDPQNLRRLLEAFTGLSAFRWAAPGEHWELADVRDPSFFGVVDSVYRKLAMTHKGTSRWVEKSPMNIQFMLDIAENLPSSRFIHIYRDGRDVAASNKRRFYWDPQSTMYRWVKVVRRGRSDGATLGANRYFELKYEDFTEQPAHWMEKICRFAGIPYNNSLLQSGMPWLNGPGRNASAVKSGKIVRNSGKWTAELGSTGCVRLEKLGGKLLAELGYQTAMPESEESPTTSTKNIWRIKDYVARLRVQIHSGRLLKHPTKKLGIYMERIRYRKSLRR